MRFNTVLLLNLNILARRLGHCRIELQIVGWTGGTLCGGVSISKKWESNSDSPGGDLGTRTLKVLHCYSEWLLFTLLLPDSVATPRPLFDLVVDSCSSGMWHLCTPDHDWTYLCPGSPIVTYANSFQPPVQQLAGNVFLVMSKIKVVVI